MKNKLSKRNHLFIFMLLLVFLFIFIPSYSFAAPQIINKLTSAFENIEKWFLKLATPAAAVAVGVGVFMKKFSFGDEERIRTSKKIIRGTLISYAFLLAIDLILAAIKSLV